jgi:uncharacterized protein YggE
MRATTTAIVALVLTSAANASDIPDYPFVFAEGSVTTKVAPDIGVISYRVRVQANDSENAMHQIETLSAKTLAVLAEHGVEPDDIIGFEIDKDVVRDDDQRDKLKILGYVMTRHIRFTLRDLKKYEPIVSALLKTDNVISILADFDRTDRDELESRLLADAVTKARAKAETMAKGSGQQIVKLRAISQRGFQNFGEEFGLGNRRGFVFESRDSGPMKELLFVPSTIEFSSSVSVIYELAEKNALE